MRIVDLDGVATSAPESSVVDAMLPWLSRRHASTESLHARGAAARRAIEEARSEVAALVGSSAEEVVFTSGATEANNLAVRGAAALLARRGRSPRIAVAAHEHASLLHPARSLSRDGCALELVPVGRDGLVDPDSLAASAPDLFALGHAHAELGSLQPAAPLCALARERGGFVTLDATLTAGRIAVEIARLGEPNLVTLSFHHMGGPSGIGALVVRGSLPIPPLIEGGAQERGYRPGSPNLPGIVGAGVAARLARRDIPRRAEALGRLGRILFREVTGIEGVRPAGPAPGQRLPGHLAVIVDGVDGEALVLALEQRGILAATASPCATEAGLPSTSLRASGYAAEEARRVVVFCVPPTNLPAEAAVLRAVALIREEIHRLRSVSFGS